MLSWLGASKAKAKAKAKGQAAKAPALSDVQLAGKTIAEKVALARVALRFGSTADKYSFS